MSSVAHGTTPVVSAILKRAFEHGRQGAGLGLAYGAEHWTNGWTSVGRGR